MAIAVAKACGSSSVFATEVNDWRREMAKKMGADVVLNPAEGDEVARIKKETAGTVVDVLLHIRGNQRALAKRFRALPAGSRASTLWMPRLPARLYHFPHNVL